MSIEGRLMTDGSTLEKAPDFSLVFQILVIVMSQSRHIVLTVNTAITEH